MKNTAIILLLFICIYKIIEMAISTMKATTKLIEMLMFFTNALAFGAYENHDGKCHDKVKSPVPNCKLCDTISETLGD